MNRTRLATIFAVLSLICVASAQQPTPSADRLKADAGLLDQLQKVFISAPQFGDEFWRESKRLADERGPEIIHAIMIRSRTWQGAQGLIFVPIIALLPRDPALKVLKEYEHSTRESDRIWSSELQVELEASDTKEMVRKYSGPK